MGPEDLARLNEPYPEHVEPTDADARAAIGVALPHWTVLEDEIVDDFTEQTPYGIGWWAPDPGTSRRILISDQLHCCLESVAGNMTEAALHWLEYLGASDRDSARLADAVKITPTGPVISPPRPRSPLEHLCPEFIRIHQAGIIRALASALDCLAGVIIGVAALPMSVLRAEPEGDDSQRPAFTIAQRPECQAIARQNAQWIGTQGNHQEQGDVGTERGEHAGISEKKKRDANHEKIVAGERSHGFKIAPHGGYERD